MSPQKINSPESGIAIGAILLVIALLSLLGIIIAAGSSDFGTASMVDRIVPTITSQASLIRAKINQCNIQYLSALALCVPSEPCSVSAAADPYPLSNTSTGTPIGSLLCDPMGTQSLWTDAMAAQAPAGFNDWYYINADATNGGRCIWTTPSGSNPSSNNAFINGLTKAANKFTNQAFCDNSATPCTTDVIYNPSSASQKFVFWITLPVGTPDSHCLP